MESNWYALHFQEIQPSRPRSCHSKANPSFSKIPANSSAESVARDLESFARHAGRTTVTTDDVLLITRRNDVLHGIMKDFVEKEQVAAAKEKGTKVSKGKAVKGKGKKYA